MRVPGYEGLMPPQDAVSVDARVADEILKPDAAENHTESAGHAVPTGLPDANSWISV